MQKSLSFVSIVLIFLFVILPANAQEEKGDVYYDFGVFAYEDEDYEGAEKNFIKALEFNSENPSYNHFLGKTYLKMERYDEAMTYFNKAREMSPDMPGLKYDTAFLFYKMSEYSKAADLFTEAIKKDPSNVPAYYYAGISLFKQDRYQKALDYFISASEKSPSLKASGYYYAGICFQKMGELEKAVEKFTYVRDSGDTALLRESAAKWLQAIESQKAALKPYRLYFKLGYQYDDNVLLEPINQDIPTDEKDSAVVATFSGSYNAVNRADLKIGAGYTHYQIRYDSLSELDFTGSIGNLYAKYSTGSVTAGLAYLPNYYWLGGNSYLRRHQIRPDVVWNVANNLSLRLAYSYYDNNYLLNNERDGHTHEGSLDVYHSLLGRKVFLFAGALYEDNTASNPYFDYGQWKTKLGISVELGWELNLSLTGKYYYKEYDTIPSGFVVQRKDNRYYGAVSLARSIFWEWLGIVAEYNYTKNDSNFSAFEYKRNVYNLSMTANF
jgi:tetratricopeptide (TPR) repeat protein